MINGRTSPRVDQFFLKAEKWKKELEKLRSILLDCQLTEALKWGVPIYMFQNSNIIGINGLKESCALSFFKGALLEDAQSILIKPGKHTQLGRWIKFTSVREITEMEQILKVYIYEAIEVERAGVSVHVKKEPEPIPEEFQHKLDTQPALKAAFESLTPGRQRAYILYFSAPKLSQTRESRVERCLKRILHGKGLNDQ